MNKNSMGKKIVIDSSDHEVNHDKNCIRGKQSQQ